MLFEGIVRLIIIFPHGSLFYGSVSPFNLSVSKDESAV